MSDTPNNAKPLDVDLVVDLSQQEFEWLSDPVVAMDMVGVLRLMMRVGMYHTITDGSQGVEATISKLDLDW